jgi:TM2 domain-containing membrane protein YozV
MSETENLPEPAPVTDAVPTRSVWTAYALLLSAGLFGSHRMYLGRWLSALAYVAVLMLAIITLEELLVYALLAALVVDLFLVPHMTKTRNVQLESEFAAHPERFEIAQQDHIAPWARVQRSSFLHILGTPVRIFLFLGLPALFTAVMVWTDNHEFVVFPVIILLASGLVSSLDQITKRHPALLDIPGVESALQRVHEMRTYYWDHEPKFLVHLWGMIARARTEYAPYWKIAGLVALAIMIDAVFSYEDTYLPYLHMEHAVGVLFGNIFLSFIAVMFFLTPLSALSFHYSLAGQHKRLRVLTVMALVVIGLTFYGSIWSERHDDEPSMLSQMRLELRMEEEDFLLSLYDNIGMFLLYYPPDTLDLEEAPVEQVCGTTVEEEPCPPTQWLRELMKGIAPNDEVDAFEVFDTRYEDSSGIWSAWRGVRIKYGSECRKLGIGSNYIWCDSIFKPDSIENQSVEEILCRRVLEDVQCATADSTPVISN